MKKLEGKRRFDSLKEYVVFDLETTGTSSDKDEIIEISAVKVSNGEIVDEFSTLVNPGCHIPFFVSKVTGIKDSMVEGKPCCKEALREFLNFIDDSVLVGHNIKAFDLKFLNRFIKDFGMKNIENDYIDTLALSRAVLTDRKTHNLSDLSKHFGVSYKGAHRALNDCKINQKIYECLKLEMIKKPLKTCPRCGNVLKKRCGKFGEFWGCRSYPDCKYTEDS